MVSRRHPDTREFARMSFDLAVFSAAAPLTADEARDVYLRLSDEEDWSQWLKEDARVDRFVSEIRQRWPDINDLPDDEVDDSPWSVGFDVSPAHLIVSFVWSTADQAVPAFIEVALRHGLYVFDPQEDALILPNGQKRIASPQPEPPEMTCARCGRVIARSELRSWDWQTDEVMHLECQLESLDAEVDS
jgi:hypothetical protein